MMEAMTSLEDIANDPEEDEKIRWTASESIALIRFGQKAEDFEGLTIRMDALEKLSLLNSLRALARIDGFEKDIESCLTSEKINSKQSASLLQNISKVKKSLEGHKSSVELAGNLFAVYPMGAYLF